MTTEKMNVHRALAELKTIDARIEKAIRNAKFCVANKHSNLKISGKPIEQFIDEMKSDFAKITDLIKRREVIKRAVVASNATTKVIVNDREYTVAEAIEMKNHGVEMKRRLLSEMQNQYAKEKGVADKNNGDALVSNAEKYVIGLYGSKENRVDNDLAEKTQKSYIEQNTYDLIDPLHVKAEIEKLEEDINKFMAEVDATLSVSNAVTEIEFSY